MPPRATTDRSPISVMRWSDDYSSCSSSVGGSSKTKMPLSKSVRFADENEVFEITHLDDIPEAEVEATWYDAGEYADIKSAYQLTIFMMEAGETLNPLEHTSRGLEYRTQEGAWSRYENKRDAYNAVLDEQDRQWQIDIDDFDEIARIYLSHSKKCSESALARGLHDEQEAMEILKTIMPPKKLKKKKMPINEKPRKPKREGSLEDVNRVQETLRERSSTRRSEIRDDIKSLESSKSKDKKEKISKSPSGDVSEKKKSKSSATTSAPRRMVSL
jgi:hypothetical protein